MGYLSRLPNPNNPPPPQVSLHRWSGENDLYDLPCLILNEMVHHCQGCQRWTAPRFLNEEKLCPDCLQKKSTTAE